MAEQAIIAAEPRAATGTGAARAARRNGMIPGVVYGADRENVPIAVAHDALDREAGRPGFFAQLYKLEVGGEAMDVVARDLQLHPVTDAILHVDFMAVKADATLTVNVPVVFLNEDDCTGLTRGGVLNVVRHEIEVSCPARSIPESIGVDLAGLDIGDSIHISAVALPEGVAPTIDDRDFTIATVAAPTVAAEIADAEEGGADEMDDAAEDAGEARDESGES